MSNRLLFDRRLRDPRMVPTGSVRIRESTKVAALWMPGLSALDFSSNRNFIQGSSALYSTGGSGFGPAAVLNNLYLTVGNSASICPPTVTVFALVNASTIDTYGTLITKNANMSGWATPYWSYNLGIAGSPAVATFGVYDGATNVSINASAASSPGVWYFIVGTFDGATLRLYVNGAQVATGSASSIAYVNFGPLYVGGVPPPGTSPNVNGLYPLAGVASGAWTAAQVAEFADAPFSMLESAAPITFWDVGASGITALLSQMLPPLTIASAGRLAVRAAATEALPSLGRAIAGTSRVRANLSATLAPVAPVILARAAIRAQAAQVAAPLGGAAAGTLRLRSTLAETLAACGFTGLGFLSSGGLVAALEATLGPLGLSAKAALGLRAALDETIGGIGFIGLGTIFGGPAIIASVNVTFAPFVVSATGQVRTWPKTPFAKVVVRSEPPASPPLVLPRIVRLP